MSHNSDEDYMELYMDEEAQYEEDEYEENEKDSVDGIDYNNEDDEE